MGIFDRLFKRTTVQATQPPKTEINAQQPDVLPKKSGEHKKWALSLEGTRFPLFANEARFFAECRRTGLAALFLSFTEFWPISGRASKANAITGSIRLLCSTCIIDMADSFRFSLPGGLGDILGGIVAVGENLPNNLPAAAKAAKCPYCGSGDGILLCDNPNYGEITEQDLEALRELWRFRAQRWWNQNDRADRLCDGYDCSVHIPRGEGYHRGFDMICEQCVQRSTATEVLPKLIKDPNYFGISELRRARNFKFEGWRFEQGDIIEV